MVKRVGRGGWGEPFGLFFKIKDVHNIYNTGCKGPAAGGYWSGAGHSWTVSEELHTNRADGGGWCKAWALPPDTAQRRRLRKTRKGPHWTPDNNACHPAVGRGRRRNTNCLFLPTNTPTDLLCSLQPSFKQCSHLVFKVKHRDFLSPFFFNQSPLFTDADTFLSFVHFRYQTNTFSLPLVFPSPIPTNSNCCTDSGIHGRRSEISLSHTHTNRELEILLKKFLWGWKIILIHFLYLYIE